MLIYNCMGGSALSRCGNARSSGARIRDAKHIRDIDVLIIRTMHHTAKEAKS